MRRFIVGFLATIGTLVLLAIVAGAAFFASGPFSPKPLPQQMVLSLDLRSLPPETTSTTKGCGPTVHNWSPAAYRWSQCAARSSSTRSG